MTSKLTFTGNGIFQIKWPGLSGIKDFSNDTLAFYGNDTVKLDSHYYLVKRLILRTNRTCTFNAGDSLGISYYITGDWNGATLNSNSPGSYYYLTIPSTVGTGVRGMQISDCYNYGIPMTVNMGADRGHNYGITYVKKNIW